jgi:hypothetical protein
MASFRTTVLGHASLNFALNTERGGRIPSAFLRTDAALVRSGSVLTPESIADELDFSSPNDLDFSWHCRILGHSQEVLSPIFEGLQVDNPILATSPSSKKAAAGAHETKHCPRDWRKLRAHPSPKVSAHHRCARYSRRPNRQLDKNELGKATELPSRIRNELTALSDNDPHLLFDYRRKSFKELGRVDGFLTADSSFDLRRPF